MGNTDASVFSNDEEPTRGEDGTQLAAYFYSQHRIKPSVLLPACNPNFQRWRQEYQAVFMAILSYVSSLKPAWATCGLVSINK